MGGIFISYRRGDSAPYARLLRDDLGDRFGSDLIFRDIDNIYPGAKFADVIDEAIAGCSAFIALIGDEWLTVSDDAGGRRLDDPDDYVRLEITSALARNILVVPVLIESTKMPDPDALPEPLRPLVMRQAVVLTDAGWKYQVQQLIDALGAVVVTPAVSAPVPPDRPAPAPAPAAAPNQKLFRRPLTLAIAAALVVVALLVANAVIGDERSTDRAQSPPTTVQPVPTTGQPADAVVERLGSGFRVSVPSGWKHSRESTVTEGNARAELWTDPADPNRKLRVLGSNCGPCATTDGRADVSRLIPAAADPSKVSSGTRATYDMPAGENPYGSFGLLRVFPTDSLPQGYYRVDLWLPVENRSLATSILNSFRLV